MATVKISALPAAASVALVDLVPIVKGGVTDRATFAQVRAALVPIVLTSDVTGTLAVGNGGTGFTSFGAGVATFLQTPSGANLAGALTSAIPAANVVQATGTGIPHVVAGALSAASSLIVNADVNAAAAIAGTKIAPDFGAQAVKTTGSISGSDLGATGVATNASGTGNVADVVTSGTGLIIFTSAGVPTVVGFVAPSPARCQLLIVFAPNGNVVLSHEDVAETTAANRIHCGKGGSNTILSGSSILLFYSTNDSRWHTVEAYANIT